MGSLPCTKTNAFSWKKLDEGHWRRPLAGMEPVFLYFGNATASLAQGREHFVIYSIIKVETTAKLEVENIEHAWKSLRFEQPGLATTADARDWSMHYRVPDKAALQDWVSQMVQVVRNGPAAQVYAILDSIHTATIYWLPDSNELIFRLPHWQADGIGSWLLWDAFLTKLCNAKSAPQPKWGEEVANLKPSLEAIWAHGEIEAKHAEKGEKNLMFWLTQAPGVGPPTMTPAIGKSQYTELIFDQETTSKIIEKCHEQNITVTAAVHAALALANNSVEQRVDDPRTANYVSMIIFNVRNYLGELYAKSESAANLYFTNLAIVAPIGNFKDMSRHFQNHYKGVVKDLHSMAQVTSQFEKAVSQMVQSPAFHAAPVQGDALLSSLGVAERFFKRRYGDVEIVDLRNGADIVLGLAMVFVYTFGDRLRLTYYYNEAAQDGKMIRRILDGTGEFLKQGLRM